MIARIRSFIKSEAFRELFVYGLVGVGTTLVNIVSFWLLNGPVRSLFTISEDSVGYLTFATAAANVISIAAAYYPNRRFVFRSRATGFRAVLREAASFFAARLAALGLDVLAVDIMAGALGWDDMLSKILSNVIVLVFNYVLSKFVIFRRKGGDKAEENDVSN